MKRFLNVAVLLAAAHLAGPFFVSAQPALAPGTPVPSTADGPRIRFSETVFNFGRIKASAVVRHDFIVTNTGNALLEITSVRPGCASCTTVLPWDRQVAPGQTGKIPVQFDPASFNGPVTKSVTVTCNDPTQSNHPLQFQATVWRPIEVQPASLYFMPVEGEETNETKVVRLSSHLDEPLTLESPHCSNPAFRMELKTVQPGKEFELQVRYAGLVSNAIPQGLVTIKTSSPDLPTINVTAQVMPQPAFTIMPAQITLPAALPGAGYRPSQMIRNNTSVPMKVTAASVNAPDVTVQVTETQPGKLFLLNVSFPGNFQSDLDQQLELTVNTSHPKRPVIKVPIVRAPAPMPAVARPPSSPLPTGAK